MYKGIAVVILICALGKSSSFAQGDSSKIPTGEEVGELKEIVMLSMLEKESASERLRAVSLTEGMNKVSD